MFLVIYFLFLVSCNKKNEANEINSIETKLYAKYSSEISGNIEYYRIYNQAIDSIKTWSHFDLKAYLNEQNSEWVLDSLVCFNRNFNKAIMAIAKRNTKYDHVKADGLTYFYGIKIKNKWYFFKGPYIAIIRDNFQKDIHTPLPFTKLHEIAMDNIFRGYLKKNKQSGEWEINEGFFSGFAPKNQAANGYGSCFECKTEEEYYLYLVNKNWRERAANNSNEAPH